MPADPLTIDPIRTARCATPAGGIRGEVGCRAHLSQSKVGHWPASSITPIFRMAADTARHAVADPGEMSRAVARSCASKGSRFEGWGEGAVDRPNSWRVLSDARAMLRIC
jgi:hypothetical protein